VAGKRWLRLDVAWEDSEWLDDIDGTASGSWPRILSLVKRDGVGGRCKRPSLKVMARKWRVPVGSIEELEEAAIKDGALVVEDGDWVVMNWEEYQGADSTAAARKKRQRDRESRLSRDVTCVTRDNRDRGRDLSRATETETETSTTNTQRARGQKASTANGRGYDARALQAWEHWCELGLALPDTVSEHDHMRRLTLLFTGPPKAWKTTEIFAAMKKLKDAPDEWGWVLSEGPGYLAHQPRGKRQVIEQVLTKTRGNRSGRETADARADRLMAEMEAEDASTG